jgi:large subunit ribosomal protein L21
MKAVIETGGKQYYVEEGSVIYVEKLDAEVGSKIKFDRVLMVNDVLGKPYVANATVEGEVVKHGKNKKIIVFKYNQKKKYRKTQGHRQPYTKVEIKSIKTK